MKLLESSLSNPLDIRISPRVQRDRVDFLGGCADQQMLVLTAKLIDAAIPVLTRICHETKRTGAIIGVTKREKKFPIYLVEVGTVDYPDPRYQGGKRSRFYEFGGDKAKCLQDHPQLLSSRENEYLPVDQQSHTTISGEVVPGGAIAIGEYIVTVSGVSSDPIDDEFAARKIVAGVKNYPVRQLHI